MHSTDYRAPDSFSSLKVACFGAGPSGVDIALDLTSEARQVRSSSGLPVAHRRAVMVLLSGLSMP